MSGKRGRGWTESDVVHLFSAWPQVSEDASVVAGHKVNVFWRRVCDTLAAHLQAGGLLALDKEWNHAQAKQGSISRDVSLFAAKYQQVINLNESRKTDADCLLDAQSLFHHSSQTGSDQAVWISLHELLHLF